METPVMCRYLRSYATTEKTRARKSSCSMWRALRDPKAFLKEAHGVVKKKPILAMKAGRTEEGQKQRLPIRAVLREGI